MATKTPPIPPEQLSADTSQFFDVLNKESDLAVILIAASFLDECLRSLLAQHLQQGQTADRVLSSAGILGEYRARADMAYLLNLVPKSRYQDLIVVGAIRNHVAHNHKLKSFDDPTVVEMVSKLHTYLMGDLSDAQGRTRFMLSVTMGANWMILDTLAMAQKERAEPKKEASIVYKRVVAPKRAPEK